MTQSDLIYKTGDDWNILVELNNSDKNDYPVTGATIEAYIAQKTNNIVETLHDTAVPVLDSDPGANWAEGLIRVAIPKETTTAFAKFNNIYLYLIVSLNSVRTTYRKAIKIEKGIE